jgi:hypothetical protein
MFIHAKDPPWRKCFDKACQSVEKARKFPVCRMKESVGWTFREMLVFQAKVGGKDVKPRFCFVDPS